MRKINTDSTQTVALERRIFTDSKYLHERAYINEEMEEETIVSLIREYNVTYTGVHFGTKLIISNMEFNSNEFIDCSFNDITMRYSLFNDCVFVNVDFGKFWMYNVKFDNCRFINCTLKEHTMKEVEINRTPFICSNLNGIHIVSSKITNTRIEKSDFLGGSLDSGNELKCVWFEGCDLRYINFSGTLKVDNINTIRCLGVKCHHYTAASKIFVFSIDDDREAHIVLDNAPYALSLHEIQQMTKILKIELEEQTELANIYDDDDDEDDDDEYENFQLVSPPKETDCCLCCDNPNCKGRDKHQLCCNRAPNDNGLCKEHTVYAINDTNKVN